MSPLSALFDWFLIRFSFQQPLMARLLKATNVSCCSQIRRRNVANTLADSRNSWVLDGYSNKFIHHNGHDILFTEKQVEVFRASVSLMSWIIWLTAADQ